MACSLGKSSIAAASSFVTGKLLFKVPRKRIKVHRLWLPMMIIAIASFRTAARMAHVPPVGRLVTRAGETGRVDKGFGQIDPVPVGSLPIVTQLPEIKPQNFRCQVLYPNPRKNQKTCIAGDQMEPPPSCSMRPADKCIAAFHLEGRTGPGQAGHHLVIKPDQVLQTFADKLRYAQIMVMVEQIAPQVILSALNGLKLQVGETADRAFQRGAVKNGPLGERLAPDIFLRPQTRRQLNKAVFFQPQKKITGGISFLIAIGLNQFHVHYNAQEIW